MSKLSRKLYSWQSLDGRRGLSYWCPACRLLHSVKTTKGGWHWNGDVDSPTIQPDQMHQFSGIQKVVCHLIIIDGFVKFYSDCTHGLAGTIVPLPDLPDHMQ